MTPRLARLTVLLSAALLGATAINALFLQDGVRKQHRVRDVQAVQVQAPPQTAAAERAPLPSLQPSAVQPASPTGNAVAPSTAPPPASRVTAAVLRELARKGYPVPAQGSDNVAAVVIPYEFDSQLPLSGEASDLVLKRLIFDQRPAPKGAFADRAEADTRLVLAVQKTLLELGFFAGRLSGQMDSWTQKAVVAFERHRSIPQTGRFTETTLAALIAYSGKPLERVSFPGP